MDEFNSAMENDLAFSQTNTLYDFYEHEVEWTTKHKKIHPLRHYIHEKTDDQYKDDRKKNNKKRPQ